MGRLSPSGKKVRNKMNAMQVYRAVSDMISQGYVESEAALRASLNRALAEIGRLYPRKQFLTLRHFCPPAVFRLPLAREVKKESPLTVSALSCEGIYCKGSGRGEVVITSNGMLLDRVLLDGLPFSLAKTATSLGADKKAEITLLFRSEDGMLLEELVLYERLIGGEIPTDSHYAVYSMADHLPGFVAFSGECRKNGLPFSGVGEELVFEHDAVKILCREKGVYEIGCYTAPCPVDESNEDERLGLSAELLYLVPLLTAYYAALEAEDGRAADFLARYNQAKHDLRQRAAFAVNETVEDLRGW